VDHGQLDHCQIVERQFLVARRDPAAFFEPAHDSLDHVALSVRSTVEGSLPRFGGLVGEMRDHRLNPQDLQHAPDRLARIRLVSCDLPGNVPRRRPGIRHRYRPERFFDVLGFMILAGTNVGSEGDGATASDQMELRPKPAS